MSTPGVPDNLQPILVSADARRDVIRSKAVEGIKNAFPLSSARYDLHVEDVQVHPQEYSSSEQKQALLEGKSLSEPVKGVLVLKDKEGKEVDRSRPTTLLHLPWYTQRHSFVVDGNEYSVSNQVRLRPGVYTRRRGNQELEAQFNLIKKGGNFGLTMEPETGHLHIKAGTSHIPLYPVLRSLGISSAEIARNWGSELAGKNESKYGGKAEMAMQKLYDRFTPEYRQTAKTHEDRVAAVREWFNTAKMDPDVVQKTLGVSHGTVQPQTLLTASTKLLKVFKQAEDVDDRDSLEFKRLHSVDDFIHEKLSLASRDLKRKIAGKLDHAGPNPNVSKLVPASMFTSAVKSFLTTSDVSSIPTQYNPMEIIDLSQRVTPLGEGGIGDARAVTMEARQVHPSHLGIIDPVRTSESEGTGADVRAGIHAARDKNGTMYAPFHNAKTGKVEYLSADRIMNSVIAFPGENIEGKAHVDAMHKGVLKSVSPKEVQYIVPHAASMYSPVTNLVPLIESMQGNRTLMAAKMQTQALSLKGREAPLVQVESYRPGRTMEQEFGEMSVPVAPVSGTVAKVDGHYIYIRPHTTKKSEERVAAEKDDGLVKVRYDHYFPLATKTFLHNELTVKEGDKVQEGKPLAESNFTRDGALALGKNLNVAMMAYRGMNSNDAIVISEGAAQKLTSEHMYKEFMELDADLITGREKHRTYFGNQYTRAQYDRLDEDGVVKKGSKVNSGDPLFVGMRKSVLSAENAILGKLHKSLVKPYRDVTHTWEHHFEGTVVDVVKTPKSWAVTVMTEEAMQVGDKLSGRHGNKGIVSAIIPDNKMPQDAQGRPLDMLYTSAGVVSRINPSQVIEMAVAKVAQKTGKPIAVPQFSKRNNVEWAKSLLREHGLTDKETVYDPESGKKVPGIMVGPQYVFKLMKTTSTNYSARGVEDYDVNQQPTKGGSDGAKGLGRMEFAGLVAHNARNILREHSVLKSQKNDEFWRAVQLGLPPPSPKTTFAYQKFGNMLTGAGIKFDKTGNHLGLSPLTDKDVEKLSSGAVQKPLFVRSKDLHPEKDGLFDPALTGGTSGTKWAHVDLHEPIVNPVFEDPARRFLGMTGPEFKRNLAEKGAGWVKDELAKIDLKSKREDLLKQTKTARGSALDNAVKQLKYIDGLQKSGLTPDKAYVLTKIPVVPPVVRPIMPNPAGDMLVNDANYLYRDLMLANEKLKVAKDELTDEHVSKARTHLQEATSALFGLGDPVSPQNAARGVKGFISLISGQSSPKHGYFQGKLIKRQLDLSGRGTIAPDVNLGMEEIGLPEEMLWKLFGPFVIGRLVRRGYPATQAKDMLEKRAPAAREELLREAKERPVIYNRAPTLHRYNLIAAYPRAIPGQTIRIPATWAEPLMNADYDGDTMQIHTPVSRDAIEDAKKMTLPNMLFADKTKGRLHVLPAMEAVIGAYKATSMPSSGAPVKKFKTREEALAAYRKGEIGINDPVEVDE